MSLYSKLLGTSKKAEIAGMKISKTNSDPAAIEIDEESQKILNNLLSKFRRCLCKKKADNEVTICFLDDTNSNFYHDGTSSNLTGTEGDVMVYFPEFWYKGDSDSDPDWHILQFSENQPDDSWHHAPASLVGAYKGYVLSNKLYSISGVEPSSNITIDDFSDYSRSRGTGYHIIDYQQHCIIAWMFYAKYKTRDSQGVCGAGSYSTLSNGTTNNRGIRDTTSSEASLNSDILVNFLGLEGCWGEYHEYIEGIHLGNDNKVNVYDKGYQSYSQSPTKRQFDSLTNESGGYIKDIHAGGYMDMLPSDVSGTSYTTYYCDSYSSKGYGNTAYSRSGVTDYNYYFMSGVSLLESTYDSYVTSFDYSSRLAFDGNITVENNIRTFKSLPVL